MAHAQAKDVEDTRDQGGIKGLVEGVVLQHFLGALLDRVAKDAKDVLKFTRMCKYWKANRCHLGSSCLESIWKQFLWLCISCCYL